MATRTKKATAKTKAADASAKVKKTAKAQPKAKPEAKAKATKKPPKKTLATVTAEPTSDAKPIKGRYLVVVESPAKAKTIKKYLGSGYTVKASVGHVMDLPKSKMGVDIEHGFKPQYEI